MPQKHIVTEIEGVKLKLSNLDKILYPDIGVSKAELIQYYLMVAARMKPLVWDRPMTLIRYPDGIDKEMFYSKNLPSWTPEWIKYTRLDSKDDNRYLVLDQTASLIWAANLAAIELHSTQTKVQHLAHNDHFIFDLDPPEGSSFEDVKQLAQALKPFLETYGYHPYVKTSGSKGLHIYVPIEPLYSHEVFFGSIKKLAQEFASNHPDTTLILSKEKRQGRVLLDIYRNHLAQTCAVPYATRARTGAPISCPISWQTLAQIQSSKEFTIRNIHNQLDGEDPWADFNERRVRLHDEILQPSSSSLAAYMQKRDFNKTTEPAPESTYYAHNQQRYCVQIHDATNLHYDLRLEFQGVLLSWALPKGLPQRLGEKRLAIRTEDHPIKYLDFEGTIPKDQYGGGTMWVYEHGTYEAHEWKDNVYTFTLNDGGSAKKFKLFKTKGDQWLIHAYQDMSYPLFKEAIPMLAAMGHQIPSRDTHFFEIKWDGIRVIVFKNMEKVHIISRGGNDLDTKFPQIVQDVTDMEAQTIVMDGEIVVLDDRGSPNFGKVVGRMHLSSEVQIAKAAQTEPATFYAFDCLYLDGKDLCGLAIERRRDWLQVQFKPTSHLRFSEDFEDGEALFEAAKSHGLEGIIAKRKGSLYEKGSRSDSWQKFKVRTEMVVSIIGYTIGQGDRVGTFGALHCVETQDDGTILYRGKIGTGYNENKIALLMGKIQKCKEVSKPYLVQRYEVKESVWIEPWFEVRVNYASITSDGILREPVFMEVV